MQPLPNELIFKIITHTIAESVHSVCIRPLVDFELNVVPILSAVSFSFRQITTEVVDKAFGSDPIEESPATRVRKKIAVLRGMCIYAPPQRFDLHLTDNRRHLQDGTSLMQAYFLYMAAVHFRRNATNTHDPVIFVTAMTQLQAALGMAREKCEMARPLGIEVFVRRAVEREAAFVGSGTAIVKACAALSGSLDMPVTTEEVIHARITEIEKAVRWCAEIVDVRVDTEEHLEYFLDRAVEGRNKDEWRISLPGVSVALGRCRGNKWDEYGIAERANTLIRECKTIAVAWALYAWMTHHDRLTLAHSSQ